MDPYELEFLIRSQRVDRFVEMIERVDTDGESFTITRDGKPVAVVISPEAHQRLIDAYVDASIRAGSL